MSEHSALSFSVPWPLTTLLLLQHSGTVSCTTNGKMSPGNVTSRTLPDLPCRPGWLVVLPPLALAPLVGLLGCPLVVLLVVLLCILLAPIADKWYKAAGATVGGRVILCSVVLHIGRPVDVEGLTGAFSCRLVAAL